MTKAKLPVVMDLSAILDRDIYCRQTKVRFMLPMPMFAWAFSEHSSAGFQGAEGFVYDLAYLEVRNIRW